MSHGRVAYSYIKNSTVDHLTSCIKYFLNLINELLIKKNLEKTAIMLKYCTVSTTYTKFNIILTISQSP